MESRPVSAPQSRSALVPRGFSSPASGELRAAGYGIRRVDNGWELACIGDEEVEHFSKRTTQIEAEAKRDHKKLWASARWLAEKTGMDVADAYAMEKAKLGGRTREKKSQ